MERFRIAIDTREQRPWKFPEQYCSPQVTTLKTGDYAIPGDEENFCIERKSLDDFLQSISTGYERFHREIERMKKGVIIVEASFTRCCFVDPESYPEHNHPRLTPAFIASRLGEITADGVPVIFADNRDIAAAFAFNILKHRHKKVFKYEKN